MLLGTNKRQRVLRDCRGNYFYPVATDVHVRSDRGLGWKPNVAQIADFASVPHSDTSGSAMAEGPRDALVSRNSATTKYTYRMALFA